MYIHMRLDGSSFCFRHSTSQSIGYADVEVSFRMFENPHSPQDNALTATLPCNSAIPFGVKWSSSQDEFNSLFFFPFLMSLLSSISDSDEYVFDLGKLYT